MKTRLIKWPAAAGPQARLARELAGVLKNGAAIVIPTDTVYGVAAAPEHAAILFDTKERPEHKPLPILIDHCDRLADWGVAHNPCSLALARRYWPGPLTMVLTTRTGDEGFRVPDHPAARSIIAAGGGALRVTSANISGQPPALDAAAAMANLAGRVAVIVDAGPAPGGTASTVVRVTGRHCTILRHGAIPDAAIIRTCGTPAPRS